MEINSLHILLAIAQFFLINWIGKHSTHAGYHQISFVQSVEDAPLFNAVFRIISPQIFLVIAATILYLLRLDIVVNEFWRVTAYYFGVRWSFNVAMGRAGLMNWGRQIIVAAIGVGVSVWLSDSLLKSRDLLLPSPTALRDQLWIIVIGFIYLTANRIEWPTIGKTPDERKTAYILKQFEKNKRRFHQTIQQHSRELVVEILSHAVLLYESFNRPAVIQLLERHVLFAQGLASTLGPMQVQTPVRIDDLTSVKLGVQLIQRTFEASVEGFVGNHGEQHRLIDMPNSPFAGLPYYNRRQVLYETVQKYNVRSDYAEQVLGIFDVLVAGPYRNTWAEQYPDDLQTELELLG